MHWADELARELRDRGDEHTLATGITPSGPIHVGNLREVLTTEAVHRALREAGGSSTLVYVGDTFDPLREVPPFLEDHDRVDYADHVGKPICDVPAPDGGHDSFADQFLDPFLSSLGELGVDPEVHLAHELYRSGAYREGIERALEHRGQIRVILNDVAGRDLGEDWLPFNPLCPDCGRLDRLETTDVEPPSLEVRCGCGFEGSVDALEPGAGKLPWRVDWPARWAMLDVTFEAFGKDHAASGGSWDTGVPIAEDVYGIQPPHHTVYEWIHVEGEGAMSSSKGTGIAARDVLEATPPEVLRFFFMRYQPDKHVAFDPGEGLLDLVDDYDRVLEELAEGKDSGELRDPRRVIELSQPSGAFPEHPGQTVSMRHLARLVDLYEGTDEVLASVRRSGHVDELTEAEQTLLRARVNHTRAWLATFAPEDAQVRLPEHPPPAELLHALDEFRKPRVGLLDQEAEGLASRAHELVAWLDGAPNVLSASPDPPEELATLALWRALAGAEGIQAGETPPAPRDLAERLGGLADAFGPDHVNREGSDQVLAPLVLHLVRASRRPGVERDPERLANRVERWIDETGAGRPDRLPSREGLVEMVRAVQAAIGSGFELGRDRSPAALARLTDAAGDRIGEADLSTLADEGFRLPELPLGDVLLARALLERARSGLATFRELVADEDWEAEALQSRVYETAETTGLPTGDAFGLLYLAILDQQRGPRLGPFLVGLERDWVEERLAALAGP